MTPPTAAARAETHNHDGHDTASIEIMLNDGVNRYARFDSIIILGRQQAPAAAIEAEMRCLFGDSEVPLTFLPEGRLKPAIYPRLLADGRIVDGKVQVHPDERGAAILGQLRETMTLQAIARLRLITPDRPKRVIILSNLPLPGLPIDELWSLREAAADTPRHPYQPDPRVGRDRDHAESPRISRASASGS